MFNNDIGVGMQTWIKFKVISKGYYDPRNGKVLKSIDGMKNRPGIDPFQSDGRVYPDLSKVKVLERYQKGLDLLVLVEGEQADIDALLKQEAVTFRASPKELKTESLGFQPKLKTEKEAKAIKSDVFKIKDAISSGVTN